GLPHEHIQFGSGTVDPFVHVELRGDVGRFGLSGWVLGKATLYANTHAYQAGDLLMGGLDAASDLWTRRFRFLLGAFVYHEQPERWDGVIEDEGNLGRTDLLVETAIGCRVGAGVTVTVGAKVPVWTHAV